MKLTVLLLAPGIFLATGCATMRLGSSEPGPTYEQFARQIKYEVGTFLWRHRNDPEVVDFMVGQAPGADVSGFENLERAGKIRRPTANEKCPSQINVTIDRVKFSSTTTITTKRTGTAGMDIPVGTAVLSPSLTGASERKIEVNPYLTFQPDPDYELTEEPKPELGRDGRPIFDGAIIADTLDAVTSALKRTSDTRPCFEFTDDASHGIKWGVTYANSRTAAAKFKLIIFSVGGDGTRSRSAANVVEMTLRVTGGFGN